MKIKKMFLLAPILISGIVIGCNTNKDIIDAPKSRITVAFNAGDYTFKSNKSHIMPITISSGVNWTFLKSNLDKALIDGTNQCIDYPSNVKFNYWKLDGQKIDDINPVPVFDIDGKTLEADYTITYSVKLKIDSNDSTHKLKDSSGEVTNELNYVVNKDTTYAELKAEKGFNVYKSDGTTVADDFKYFVDSTGVAITQGSEENYKFVRNNEVLTAQFASDGKTSNFVDDDWDVFCQAAEQGLEYVSTTSHGASTNGGTGGYKEEYVADSFELDGKTYPKEKNTFVGLKRKVKIGSVDYPVTIVGEDQDYSGNQKCVFTFLFDNLISNNRSFGTSSSSNNYDASAINTYLNNQFFYSLPLSLRSHLLDVNKFTNEGGGLDAYDHIVQKEEKTTGTSDKRHKLFIPSLAEMNITKYKEGYHLYNAEGARVTDVEPEGLGLKHEYNSCYKAFTNASTSDRVKKPIIVDEATGETIEGDPASYWLRSPDLATSTFTWTVNESGDIDDVTTDVSKCRGVCPGFCVGAEKSKIIVTIDPNGGTWTKGSSSTDPVDITINNENTTLASVMAQVVNENGTPTGPSGKANFLDWYTAQSGGSVIDTTSVVSASATYYAQYTSSTVYTFTSKNDKYSVTPVKFTKSTEAKTTLKATKTFIDSEGNTHSIHNLPKSSEVILKRGSTTLSSSYYSYNESTGLITVNSSATTGNINVYVNFSSIKADWSVVNEICKLDEDNQISGGTAGDIVKQYFDYGDTKTTTINSEDYKVQIIDIAHTGDTFTCGSKTVTAGLTFDFVYVPNNSGNFSNINKSEAGSKLFDYCNDSNPSNVYTKCTDLYNSSIQIKDYVKTVEKKYMKDNGKGNNPSIATISCNFFTPSLIEYGFTNNYWGSLEGGNVLNTLQMQEGSAYYLYNNIYNTTRTEMKKYSIKNTSTPISYWSRDSVHGYYSSKEKLYKSQLYYNMNGQKYYSGKSWDQAEDRDLYPSAYYAPAFCI